jgi:hypothetical protein
MILLTTRAFLSHLKSPTKHFDLQKRHPGDHSTWGWVGGCSFHRVFCLRQLCFVACIPSVTRTTTVSDGDATNHKPHTPNLPRISLTLLVNIQSVTVKSLIT